MEFIAFGKINKMSEKLKLSEITLVSVACVRVDETILALELSSKNIEFGAIKLLSHESINHSFIECIKIDRLDYIGYNRFIIYELYKYIDTKFALIIQDDGFIKNPDSWRNEFLEYDYIGAPFALPQDNFSMRDQWGNLFRVGNGGFSLRSKRILEIATEKNLEWRPFHGFWNEDGFFCVNNRHVYEQEGMKFAPLEVAKYFSHEAKIPEIEGIIPFGFHQKGYVHK